MIFYILILSAMAAWGASWVSGKLISKTLDFQVTVFWRLVITSLSFLPMLLFFKNSFKISLNAFFRIFIASIILFAINQLFFLGLQNGFAGIGGVLVPTLNPVFVFLLSILLFSHSFHFKSFLILLLGFSGGLIILNVWSISLNNLLLSGNLYFILCALSWGMFTLAGNWALQKTTIWIYSFYMNLLALFYQFFFTDLSLILTVFNQSPFYWGNLVFISLFSNTFSTSVYFIASKKIGSHKASSFSFLVPFTAVLFSWIFLGEIPHLTTLIGGCIALISVYWINFSKK